MQACGMHAHERHAYERQAYEMHAYVRAPASGVYEQDV